MDKFIPFEKLSKKKQKEINTKKRGQIPPPAQYHENKKRKKSENIPIDIEYDI